MHSKIQNLIDHIDGINDERDSVPLLLEMKKVWPDIRAALDGIMIGGNHLANVLVGMLGGGFAKDYPIELDAINDFVPREAYDIWVCWRAIMLSRKALQSE